VVSQLHRSPGVFFGQSQHANGKTLYSARIIPFKGSWMEFSTDINDVMYAYIDRKKKLPITTLLRAIGYETDKEILEIFNLTEEVKVNKASLKRVLGRRLAARVLHSYFEDFVNEDTGEVSPWNVTTSSLNVRRSWKKNIFRRSSTREQKPSPAP
jgi:DNA-directed RNA polymerase, beta subunit/140 kD subunit